MRRSALTNCWIKSGRDSRTDFSASCNNPRIRDMVLPLIVRGVLLQPTGGDFGSLLEPSYLLWSQIVGCPDQLEPVQVLLYQVDLL